MIVHIVKGLSETRIEFPDLRTVLRLNDCEHDLATRHSTWSRVLGRIEAREQPDFDSSLNDYAPIRPHSFLNRLTEWRAYIRVPCAVRNEINVKLEI